MKDKFNLDNPEDFVMASEILAETYKPYTADELLEEVDKEGSLEANLRQAGAVMGLMVELPKILDLNLGDRTKLSLTIAALSKPLSVAVAHFEREVMYEASKKAEEVKAERAKESEETDDPTTEWLS